MPPGQALPCYSHQPWACTPLLQPPALGQHPLLQLPTPLVVPCTDAAAPAPPPWSGCDKNMPGTIMAMARINRPSLMIYGGTIKPGHSAATGATLDIVSAFQAYGGFRVARVWGLGA